ncbi:leucine-rich repeat flightless-interacting protein 2-like [Macrosteles quadrilineatus]|uniref:leucine-rich repeat flightless-interacting protein 2-like n=1 Tax=Macrosteles quadrilineatus TaxID=74068 RepID=UPI0023E0DF07|nr:leucine-rich repeat flightless-interacting protein 2-like [Macrosteles quadrilineatus]
MSVGNLYVIRGNVDSVFGREWLKLFNIELQKENDHRTKKDGNIVEYNKSLTGGRYHDRKGFNHPALNQISKEPETRLATKRQARDEAREIRTKELESHQLYSKYNFKTHDVYSTPNRASSATNSRSQLCSKNSYKSSNCTSEDSMEEVNSMQVASIDPRECEEKFRKAVVTKAHLDSVKKARVEYQSDMSKEKYKDFEKHLQVLKEHKDTKPLKKVQEQLGEEQKTLEELEGVLQHKYGSVDIRLKRVLEECNGLLDELRGLKLELMKGRAA